jgi:hypothetical protein
MELLLPIGQRFRRIAIRRTRQTQIMTRPSHGAPLLVNHMSNNRFFLRRAYHFFEFTSLSTRFSNIDSASIFFNSAFSFSNSLSRLASNRFMSPYFFLTVKSLLRNIVLPANGLSRLTAIGLAKNPDDFFRAMGFAFHKRSSIELRNTHTNNGANSEGHARRRTRKRNLY